MIFEVKIKQVPLDSEMRVTLIAESQEDRGALGALVKHMSDFKRDLKVARVNVSSQDKSVFQVILEEASEPDPKE